MPGPIPVAVSGHQHMASRMQPLRVSFVPVSPIYADTPQIETLRQRHQMYSFLPSLPRASGPVAQARLTVKQPNGPAVRGKRWPAFARSCTMGDKSRFRETVPRCAADMERDCHERTQSR